MASHNESEEKKEIISIESDSSDSDCSCQDDCLCNDVIDVPDSDDENSPSHLKDNGSNVETPPDQSSDLVITEEIGDDVNISSMANKTSQISSPSQKITEKLTLMNADSCNISSILKTYSICNHSLAKNMKNYSNYKSRTRKKSCSLLLGEDCSPKLGSTLRKHSSDFNINYNSNCSEQDMNNYYTLPISNLPVSERNDQIPEKWTISSDLQERDISPYFKSSIPSNFKDSQWELKSIENWLQEDVDDEDQKKERVPDVSEINSKEGCSAKLESQKDMDENLVVRNDDSLSDLNSCIRPLQSLEQLNFKELEVSSPSSESNLENDIDLSKLQTLPPANSNLFDLSDFATANKPFQIPSYSSCTFNSSVDTSSLYSDNADGSLDSSSQSCSRILQESLRYMEMPSSNEECSLSPKISSLRKLSVISSQEKKVESSVVDSSYDNTSSNLGKEIHFDTSTDVCDSKLPDSLLQGASSRCVSTEKLSADCDIPTDAISFTPEKSQLLDNSKNAFDVCDKKSVASISQETSLAIPNNLVRKCFPDNLLNRVNSSSSFQATDNIHNHANNESNQLEIGKSETTCNSCINIGSSCKDYLSKDISSSSGKIDSTSIERIENSSPLSATNKLELDKSVECPDILAYASSPESTFETLGDPLSSSSLTNISTNEFPESSVPTVQKSSKELIDETTLKDVGNSVTSLPSTALEGDKLNCSDLVEFLESTDIAESAILNKSYTSIETLPIDTENFQNTVFSHSGSQASLKGSENIDNTVFSHSRSETSIDLENIENTIISHIKSKTLPINSENIENTIISHHRSETSIDSGNIENTIISHRRSETSIDSINIENTVISQCGSESSVSSDERKTNTPCKNDLTDKSEPIQFKKERDKLSPQNSSLIGTESYEIENQCLEIENQCFKKERDKMMSHQNSSLNGTESYEIEDQCLETDDLNDIMSILPSLVQVTDAEGNIVTIPSWPEYDAIFVFCHGAVLFKEGQTRPDGYKVSFSCIYSYCACLNNLLFNI